MPTPPFGYHLGCPIWSHKAWSGGLFRADARSSDYLAQYAWVFDTVEGNTTFYAVPKPTIVQRWREETPAGFRFCFKFPRTISHERQLRGAAAETREFLDRMTPLADRLGPLMLQLPPAFGPEALATLSTFLDALPGDFAYAAEVRHRAFFAKGEDERRFNRLLADRGIDRVVLDSRALFSTPPPDTATREAQRKKPRLPVHAIATATRPLLRYIGHPDPAHNDAFLAPWLDKLNQWLDEGREPYVFIHTPDNDLAPALAARFHEQFRQRRAVAALPEWPGRTRPEGATPEGAALR